MSGALSLNQSLPPGALLGPEVAALADLLQAHGAIWFRARPEMVDHTDDETGTWVSGWRSATAEAVARPTRPNTQNGRFDATGARPAMCFRAKTHCGYAVSRIAPTADRFSLAVAYRSGAQDAQTLFSLAGADHSNILFGAENGGELFVKDRAGTLEVTSAAPDTHTRDGLLIVSYEPGKLRCAINGGVPIEAFGTLPGMEGEAELFIGCRNHRPGLAKTLGDARISDVVYWPNRVILQPRGSAVVPADLRALTEYWRWNG